MLAYTMPFWAIPIGLFLWPEPPGRAPLIGAAIGFAGLVLFMNPGLVDWGDGRILAGNILLLLAAIFWAWDPASIAGIHGVRHSGFRPSGSSRSASPRSERLC